MFSSTGSPLGRLPDRRILGKAKLPFQMHGQKGSPLLQCSRGDAQQSLHTFVAVTTHGASTSKCLLCSPVCVHIELLHIPLHSLNIRKMTLSLAFIAKYFLRPLMAGSATTVQPVPRGTEASQQVRAGRLKFGTSTRPTPRCPGADV